MKTFVVWLEEKLDKEKVGKSLLKSLGYTPDALHHQNINLDIIPKGNLKRAIESLPIEDDLKNNLLNFARNNPHDSISNLINQIQNDDIEQQDTGTSTPATLPQGSQPAPKPKGRALPPPQQAQQPLQQPMEF